MQVRIPTALRAVLGRRRPRVLVGCEYSGTVREAFAARGWDAWSCDLLPTDRPGQHIQGDVLEVLGERWDLAIFHPPCTYLTCSAEWAYGDGPYHMNLKPGTLVGAARRAARAEAVAFCKALLGSKIPHVALENPRGHLSSAVRPPDQIVQPYQFGDDASKATCLWLKDLPALVPTKHVLPRLVNGKSRWANQTDSGQNRLSPSDDRWAIRSLTYPGIAAAMAAQWGTFVEAEIAR